MFVSEYAYLHIYHNLSIPSYQISKTCRHESPCVAVSIGISNAVSAFIGETLMRSGVDSVELVDLCGAGHPARLSSYKLLARQCSTPALYQIVFYLLSTKVTKLRTTDS